MRMRACALLNDVAGEVGRLVDEFPEAQPVDVDALRGLMEQECWALYRIEDPDIRQELCVRVAARALVIAGVIGCGCRGEMAGAVNGAPTGEGASGDEAAA